MLATLEKLIQPILAFKLRHPVGVGAKHAHTVAYLNQDNVGDYWLEIRCQHDGCKGVIRKKIPTELARQWQEEESY